jgi:predicted membrane-bound spermidine synthase
MGLVTPTISAFLSLKASDSQNEIGKISGVLYAIGTFSGVLFTLLFIYFIIPQLGVMTAVILISFLLLIASIMAYFVTYKWK